MSETPFAGPKAGSAFLAVTSRCAPSSNSEEGDLVVRVDAPGIDAKKNVDIRLDDRKLRIVVERQESEERSGKPGYRSELRYGRFVRAVRLPKAAKPDEIRATYRDGVLEVHVSLEESSGVQIPVTNG